MYTRSTRNSGRYTPPPGYTGSAFGSEMSVKHHEPDYEEPQYQSGSDGDGNTRNVQSVQNIQIGHNNDDRRALEELIHSLRGKIGTEELIILLVMLLTAADGVGIETIMLALVLLAK